MFTFLFLSAYMVFGGLALFGAPEINESGETIVDMRQHGEKLRENIQIEDFVNKNINADGDIQTDIVMNSVEATKSKLLANIIDDKKEEMKLAENNNVILKNSITFTNKDPSEFEKSDDILEENIEEMNLNNLKMNKKEDGDGDGKNIISNIKESSMTVFDEEVLEEELSEASVKPGHTPWTLIGVGVGVGVLVVLLVGVVMGGVMIGRMKMIKKREDIVKQTDV